MLLNSRLTTTLCVVMLGGVLGNDWTPLSSAEDIGGGGVPSSNSRILEGIDPDHCNLYKVVMRQDHFYQYIQYKAHIPDLKEFTLCTWHKFYNHSTDHPLFSYASRDRPREIVSWVANNEQSSFYQLAIGGHTIYRLNYPIRLYRWYHSCQSWNGRTGEWQLWIDSERVGRGFYNLLVGKTIKGGGTAVTGQVQNQFGGGFGDGKYEAGMFGEVTLVQLYKAALTAGKAYNTHKHHHAHKFHHEDKAGPDDPKPQRGAQPQPIPEGQTEFPFLRGMQIVPRLPVEELSVIRQQQQQQQQTQQDLGLNLLNGGDIMATFGTHPFRLFKREHSKNSTEKVITKREVKDDKIVNKRNLEFGVFPGVDLSGLFSGDGYSLGVGGYRDAPKDVKKKQEEPAEWEVRSIMSLCSGCGEDPFRKANVLSWRESSKKLYAGALYVPASQQCHNF